MSSEPIPRVRLSSDQRERLRRGVNAEALEELLAAVPADARALLLRAYSRPRPGEHEVFVGEPDDPRLRALMARVAPPALSRVAEPGHAAALAEPVVVALVPRTAENAGTVTLWRRVEAPRAVIVVAEEDASGDLLEQGLLALYSDEERAGFEPRGRRRITVRPAPAAPVSPGSSQAHHMARLARVIEEARRSPVVEVPGVGWARVSHFDRTK
ncbi:MAG TPA: hypothetical protein VE913_14835 [Longimicrobium sp.]|nr:hypothetical protein [Longimicrobium sp.]